MAFSDNEESIQEGRPAYFLTFSRTGKSWRYTDIDQNVTLDSQVYLATPFSIPDIVQSGDAKAEELSISIPSTTAIAQYLDARVPSEEIVVTLRKAHLIENAALGTFTAPAISDAPIFWVGEVIEVKRPSIIERELVCNTLSLTMARGGLRLTWSRSCPHVLYRRGCLVNPATFAVPLSSVTVVNGVSVSSASADAQPDGWFDGGYLTWNPEAGVTEMIGIESHIGPVLNLLGPTSGLAGGTNYVAYPGCNRTAEMCNSKFSNILNFGGIRFLTGKSPFDGNPVF